MQLDRLGVCKPGRDPTCCSHVSLADASILAAAECPEMPSQWPQSKHVGPHPPTLQQHLVFCPLQSLCDGVHLGCHQHEAPAGRPCLSRDRTHRAHGRPAKTCGHLQRKSLAWVLSVANDLPELSTACSTALRWGKQQLRCRVRSVCRLQTDIAASGSTFLCMQPETLSVASGTRAATSMKVLQAMPSCICRAWQSHQHSGGPPARLCTCTKPLLPTSGCPTALARRPLPGALASPFRSQCASLFKGANAPARAISKPCRAGVCHSPPVDLHQRQATANLGWTCISSHSPPVDLHQRQATAHLWTCISSKGSCSRSCEVPASAAASIGTHSSRASAVPLILMLSSCRRATGHTCESLHRENLITQQLQSKYVRERPPVH